MKLVNLAILLLAIVFAGNLDKSNGENDGDNVSLFDESEKQILVSEPHTRMLVIIDVVVLKSILTAGKPLQSTYKNYTENFLGEFTQFLILFSWDDPQKNEVMKLVADYNKNHFDSTSNKYIRLWVGFQPRMYNIQDDIKEVAEAILVINSMYAGTVTAVVLDYNLLQLEQESLILVNHEIEKVSKAIKNLSNESITFALQLDLVNCKSRQEFFKNLEFSYVDKLIFNVPTKEQARENEIDQFLNVVSQLNCIFSLLDDIIATFHTHVSINISLETGSYNYNRKFMEEISQNSNVFLKKSMLVFWAALDAQGDNTDNSNERIELDATSSKWLNWLQRPVQFSKQHFGAVIPEKGNIPANIILETFDKVVIKVSEHSLDERKALEKLLTDLLRNSSSAETSAPIKVTFLVTIAKNDYELNKKQFDNAIWAVAYVHQRAPNSILGVVFDWNSCGMSEMCSGYKNVNPKVLCSFIKMSKDMAKLETYVRFSLYQITHSDAIKLWSIADIDVQIKVTRAFNDDRCGEYQLEVTHKAVKVSIANEDLIRDGVTKTMNFVTAQLNLGFAAAKVWNRSISYNLVNIVDCNVNYSSAAHLTEFVLLYEKLSTWAVENNQTLYVDAGVEDASECQRKRRTAPEMNCKCGWWVAANTSKILPTYPSGVIILSKKELAVKLYESQVRSLSSTEKKSISTFRDKMLVFVLVPLLLIVAIIPVITAVLVLRYRSKYIMTKNEVANFLKGQLVGNSSDENSSAENAPYNSSKYELVLSSFTIDKSTCIGSGEFGKVFRGTIARNGATLDSAAKVANTRTLGKSHGGRMALFGLLSEIKILSYLGEHDHIVALLGAFTSNLRKGELSVFLEFCELGSLYTYLHSIQPNRQESISAENSDGIPLLEIEIQDVICHLDDAIGNELYRFCGQIACGMEFLTVKNVVHADLATRNVLLTREKVVKISDFGLSRRMYDYSEYVKQSQAPLPWRWMSPESLRRLIFNEKSDVWSFGVTLWEMFTLGDEPYPGLAYDINFPAMLTRGLRLPAPKYNVKEVYGVMTRCWNTNPDQRPSFAELKAELSQK